MALSALKHPRSGLVLVLILTGLLFIALYLMSTVTQNSEQFGEMYSLLLIANLVGLLVLAVLIGFNLLRLISQYRRGIAGSRLTVRLVMMFVILSVAPVSTVFFFSVQFLHRGIDSWFDVRIGQALEDALQLSRTSLDARMRDLLKQTEAMAEELGDDATVQAAQVLDDMRNRAAVDELTLLTQNGRIIASSSIDPIIIVPDIPSEAVLQQLRQQRNYVGLDPIGNDVLYMRVVVGVPNSDATAERHILQALSPIPLRQSELADSVQLAYAQYKKLAYLREPLKYSFTITLSLVLGLSLLTAVWAAFFSTRRLVAPIRDLVEGTRAVAAGDYGKRLPVTSHDDLGFLVWSFNDMTHKIALARDEAHLSQQQAEAQRAYLQALLERLSSGVLTFDEGRILRTVNAAASQVLGVDLSDCIGSPVEQIGIAHPQLLLFVETVRAHLPGSSQEWREEVVLAGGSSRQVLFCRGASLGSAESGQADYLIVFDDVTTLIQAQRDAAWGEVARRLAHEFKNPLTPIQLSAERLRHKYLKTMDPKDAEVLDRSTHTIVQQVEVMKEMVNAFAEYARNPQMRPRPLYLNQLINEVLDLYRGDSVGTQFQLNLDPMLPMVEADPGRLRQLLHNLIKNSLEAISSSQGSPGSRITFTTQCISKPDCRFVELRVEDQGPGIPEQILEHLFEPYVTTKPKGTGLGLAIVKKIVEEHNGTLQADNLASGGARILIRLPAAQRAESSTPLKLPPRGIA